MTPDFLRHGTPAAVLRALPGARAVGGAVRDFLAGREIHDVDVAVALPPDEVSRLLRAAGLRVFETGLKHGTVTAVLDREPVEVTSLRRDVATDGRHAEVEWIADWREDAARRDFTINAMSMGGDGEVHDFFGGREDLAAGRVRFVGVAADRLAEDYLRALRFFRFWARYGRGEPDAEAVAAIREAVPGLARLSVERVWMELKRLFQAPDPRDALGLMAETGVLEAVLPEGANIENVALLVAVGAPADPLLRFARLVRDAQTPFAITERLKMSNAEAERIVNLSGAMPLDPRGLHVNLLREQHGRVGLERIVDLLWISQAEEGSDWAWAREALLADDPPIFPLRGQHAIDMGMEPGPQIGTLFKEIREWWLTNGAKADLQQCLQKLRELAKLPPA